MKREYWKIAAKGMCVGGTMLIPGVSGGTMAMLLGVYAELVSSVSSFWKHKKESLLFLGLFSLGGGAGMLLLAGPLSRLLESYPMAMRCFFLGAVAGGIPTICRQADIQGFSLKDCLWLAFGMVFVLSFSLFTPKGEGAYEPQALRLFLDGLLGAAALVLPGISVSYLFLLMGIYHPLMKAISSLDLTLLLPLGMGLLLGTLLVTRILEKAMTRFPRNTYLLILGFVMASVLELFPGFPAGLQWVESLAALAAGYGVIWGMGRLSSWKQPR